jgi:hypothetical protein
LPLAIQARGRRLSHRWHAATRRAATPERPRIQFLAAGWNCYPGWLLRDLRNQPASPWDWMQFFSAASLPLLLSPEGIEALVADLEISSIEPAGTAAEPHFWSPRHRVRSPHDHAKQPFESLALSRRLIAAKLLRRLERLRALAANPCHRLVLLTTVSPGAYGLEGFDLPSYAEHLQQLQQALARQLRPAHPVLLVVCGPQPPALPELAGVLRLPTRWHCEDAYFALTPGSRTGAARAAWRRTLRQLERRLERGLTGWPADQAGGMRSFWPGKIRSGSSITSRLASKISV